MTRIAALNDWSVGSSEEEDVGPTREALEAEATKSYNEAIRYFAHGNLEDAHVYFCKVLENPYIEKACWPEGVEPGGTLPQDLALQYSCLKNLGNLTSKQGNYEEAAKYYLEAVQLDSSEVTLWQRLGATAIKLKDFELALVAFQEGLNVNPKHWPCLDQLLSVLFILEMYMDCLGLIISALTRDPGYIKGNAFKDKIFELQPSLLQDVKLFYCNSSVLFRMVDYDRAQGDKFIATCEALRPPCKTLRPSSPFKLQQLRKPMPKLSWADLAHSLMLTYDALVEADGLEFAARIDVFDALKPKEEKLDENGTEEKKKELNENALKNTETVKENVQEGVGAQNGEGKDIEIVKETRENSLRNEMNERDEKVESKADMHKCQNSEEKRSLSEAPQGSPLHISSRRRTIELGESQDSFRVSEKRRSVDSDTFSRPDDDLKENEERDGYSTLKATFNDKNYLNQEEADKVNISEGCRQDVGEVTEAEENLECKLGVSEENTPSESSSKTKEKTNKTENIDQETSKGKHPEASKCTRQADSGCQLQHTLIGSENDFQGFALNTADENGFMKLVKEKPTDTHGEQGEEREKDVAAVSAISNPVVVNDIIQEAVNRVEHTERTQKLDRKGKKHGVEAEESSDEELRELSSPGNDIHVNDMNTSKCDRKFEEKESGERPNLLQKHTREDVNSGITRTGAELNEKIDKTVKALNANGVPSHEDREKGVALSCEGSEQEDEDADEMEEDREDSRQEEEELEEEPEDGEEDGGSGENEMLQEEDEVLEEEGVISSEVTETEAAVNALKGIMALQPTEILGLPETDFDYDSEYVEYFDGGVYEEDDDMEEGMDQDDGMEQEETEHEEGIDQEDGVEHEGLDQEEDIDQEEGTEQEGGVDQEGAEQEGTDHEQGAEQEEGIDQENGIEQGDGTEQEEGIDQEDGTEQEDNSDQEEGTEQEGTDQEEGTEQEEGVDHEDETEQEGTEHEEEVDQREQEEGDTQQESSEQDEGNAMEEDLEEQDETEKEGVEETEDGDAEDEDEEEQEVGSQEEEVTGDKQKQMKKMRKDVLEDDLLKEKRNKAESDKAHLESNISIKESAAKNKEEKVKVNKDSEEKKANSLNRVHLDTTGESKTPETSDKTNGSHSQTNVEPKRHKRHKRGLERELEQLDYWGRRQERDAKRRRRTISSKLLGTVEEAEYLTWGDLFRSFVPTSLLNCNVDDKTNKQKTLNQSFHQDTVGCDKSTAVSLSNTRNSEDSKSTNSVSPNNSSKEKQPPLPSFPAEGDKRCEAVSAMVNKTEDISNKNLVSDDKLIADDISAINGKKSSVPHDTAQDLGSHVGKVEGSVPEDQVVMCKKSENSVDCITVNSTGNKTPDVCDLVIKMDTEQGPESETLSKCIEKEKYEDTLVEIKKKRKEVILSSSASEEAQVEAFLLLHEENGGVLDLLQQFLQILMKQHHKVWPITTAKIFTEIYPRVRNHVLHGPALSLQEDRTRLYQDTMLSLTNWELLVNLHQTSRLDALVKDRIGIHNSFSSCSHLEDDLIHLTLMLGRGDVWVEETPQFHTRLRWLQAQIKLCQEEPEDAVYYLELLLSDLDRLADAEMEYIVDRVHIETDKTIVCNSEVKRHLNFLQRSQMLEQVVDNYTDGRYRIVAELLTTIFHEPPPKPRPGVTLPTRQTQLAILIDSLHKLGDCKEVMAWGARSLAEALKRYNRAEAEEEKNRWAKTLMKITETMNVTLEKSKNIVDEVDRERLVELVSTLIQMLVIQLERPQSVQVLPFETLSPWILLHRLLAYEENPRKQDNKTDTQHLTVESVGRLQNEKTSTNTEAKKEDGNESLKSPLNKSNEATPSSPGIKNDVRNQYNSSNPVTEPPTNEPAKLHQSVSQNLNSTGISEENRNSKMNQSKSEDEVSVESKGPVVPYPSTLFLITAHDELGKHSWCCSDDGLFLLYCLDVLLIELRRSLDDQHRQLLHHTLEQISFCLYSHPSKKSKHKHLRDHGVPQIALFWDRALQLYQYYCPSHLPDFQSSQIPSITDDMATLHKRIIALLPEEAKPENRLSDVEAYINEEQAVFNYIPLTPPTYIIRDCYYLLGDYYFKNKEWTNAIKYYKLDITMNPDRLDSWAPLGLAMKAMLETQLNSCDVIQDEEAFFSLAQAGVKCLRRALKLDEYHINLWVEFGGLVYMVHSHASRLLKQDSNPDISLETFEMLEKLKGEMLSQAELCFTRALKIQEEGWDDESLPDERWLHCYMLGKIAEKQGKPPEMILQYYCKAGQHLHEIQAKYPIRINHNSPQEYAVEALEMFYRAHAYILKYLLQKEGKSIEQDVIKIFTKILDELAVGSFASCQEKKESFEVSKTVVQDADSITKSSDAQAGELSKTDNAYNKRPLEEQENADDEPPTKKMSTDKDSADVIGVIKEVVDNIITDALSKSSRSGGDLNMEKESEGRGNVGNTGQEGQETATKETNAIPATFATEKDKRDSDDEIQVVEEKVIEKKDHVNIIRKCITALKLCLSRFPQNYKAVYRLAHYYNTSKFHKDCSRARNYLLGCDFWQRVGYMPVNGLFNERKVWIQQPRNSNFFHGVWRIPNDDVDRPGSFAAHMYRCVSLTLDILPQMKDFYTVLQIALSLKNSPEKEKKYLRDNERELLSEHATQVGLQAMKDKYKVLFKGTSPVHNNRRLTFLLDVYRSYKQISKHLPGSEPHLAKMLTEAYSSYRGFKPDSRSNILREADAFCSRNQHLQYRIPLVPSTGQISINNNVSGGPVMSRRGRPPGTGRGRGRGRGSIYPVRQSPGMVAVHEAYKIYENLIRAQTVSNNKDLDPSVAYAHQKELEYYQSELLKYLRIPSVSQYFQASLQGLGTASAKLPPPPKNICISSANAVSTGSTVSQPGTNRTAQMTSTSPATRATLPTRPDQPMSVLSSIASRSEAHGVSITSITAPKLATSVTTKTLKPNMSVTVSPATTSCPPSLQARGEISVVSVSRSVVSTRATPTTTTSRPATIRTGSSTTIVHTAGISRTVNTISHKPMASETIASSTNISRTTNSSAGSTVPKLPAGTTLTWPREAPPHEGSAPRPQLQAQVRPAKIQVSDSTADGLPISVKKISTETHSSTGAPVTRPSSAVGSIKHTTLGQVSKPVLPKDMSITPAPRIKSHSKLQMPLSRTSPPSSSSSFLGAYQASLGLGGNKTVPVKPTVSNNPRGVNATVVRSDGRSPSSSQSNKSVRVTQLSTSQLLQLAYGTGGNQRGAPGNVSGLLNQYSKTQQPIRGQSRPQTSAVHGPQTSVPQRSQAASSQRPQTSGSQQPQTSSTQRLQQSRTIQQTKPPQVRQTPSKPTQSKTGQQQGGSSDDIITLD